MVLGFVINGIIGPPDGGLLFSLKGMGLAFGVYMLFYLLHAMGAGDVKLMAAVGALVGPSRWFGVFLVSAIVGGIMALILVIARRRTKKTLWNIMFVLNEMRSGRPAYLRKEELDVRSPQALGLPHGAVIAVGTVFHFAISANLAS